MQAMKQAETLQASCDDETGKASCMPPLFTISELADYLKVSTATIYRLMRDGVLVGVRSSRPCASRRRTSMTFSRAAQSTLTHNRFALFESKSDTAKFFGLSERATFDAAKRLKARGPIKETGPCPEARRIGSKCCKMASEPLAEAGIVRSHHEKVSYEGRSPHEDAAPPGLRQP